MQIEYNTTYKAIRIECSVTETNKLEIILNFLRVSGYSVGTYIKPLHESPNYVVDFREIRVIWFNNAVEDIIPLLKELTNES